MEERSFTDDRSIPQRAREQFRRRPVTTLASIAGLVGLAWAAQASWFTVPQGNSAVAWSGLSGRSFCYGDGSHLKPPWSRMELYNTQIRHEAETFQLITRDRLRLDVVMALDFRLEGCEGEDQDPTGLITLHDLAGPKFVVTLLLPQADVVAREVFAEHDSDELHGSERNAIEKKLEEALDQSLREYGVAITIESVRIGLVTVAAFEDDQTVSSDFEVATRDDQRLRLTISFGYGLTGPGLRRLGQITGADFIRKTLLPEAGRKVQEISAELTVAQIRQSSDSTISQPLVDHLQGLVTERFSSRDEQRLVVRSAHVDNVFLFPMPSAPAGAAS